MEPSREVAYAFLDQWNGALHPGSARIIKCTERGLPADEVTYMTL